MTGDSDLFAYGAEAEADGKGGMYIIVESYRHERYRLINLSAEVQPGEYPLVDLYQKHGRITFQLYAACTGCDFTTHPSGIPGIAYSHFVGAAAEVDGELSAQSLADALWDHRRGIVEPAGYKPTEEIRVHLQSIIDI